MPACSKCKVELTDENWFPSCRKRNQLICKACHYVRECSPVFSNLPLSRCNFCNSRTHTMEACRGYLHWRLLEIGIKTCNLDIDKLDMREVKGLHEWIPQVYKLIKMQAKRDEAR